MGQGGAVRGAEERGWRRPAEDQDGVMARAQLLAAGLTLWMTYGFVRSDLVIIAANGVSLVLLACIVCLKVRYDRRAASSAQESE